MREIKNEYLHMSKNEYLHEMVEKMNQLMTLTQLCVVIG